MIAPSIRSSSEQTDTVEGKGIADYESGIDYKPERVDPENKPNAKKTE